MTPDPVPCTQGEIYTFYPYNQRLLGMGYNMLETESHRKRKVLIYLFIFTPDTKFDNE